MLRVHLFFRWVGIIESDNEFTLVHFCEILIQNCCLGVANVEVATWFGGETRHDLTLLSILKPEGEASGSLIRACFA